MNIIKKFKKFLNNLDYKMCLHGILADAIEYKLSDKEEALSLFINLHRLS